MRLSEVLEVLPMINPEITGVAHDSRAVEPGDLFVALVGQRFDGRTFAPAAVEKGAVAVVGPGPATVEIPWMPVEDPRSVLGPLAAAVYGHPDRELVMAGVTGTNGKSTVATLISAVMDKAGLPAGFIGTLGYRFGERTFPGGHTTPEASDLFRTLRRMRDAGARGVAMEVSSHALEMGRVAGASFDVAVFTNLTRDHLDYHPDMESYFAAKRKVFNHLKPGGRAVVNIEDPYGERLAAEIPNAVTFGEDGDVRVRDVQMTPAGTVGTLVTPRGEVPFVTHLLGRYNLLNLLAA
ncbi:MAG TPA: UDP-N-acetylmuramoyl-L-alanyl-D-glutamate--2,6-diaminopimelate ligase, partial [Thermoanaerobaculia bacterium]|nr:UDP-N-acetylmuramoyl-L-alanyl-D-glutamate--2,6-diaminopimelate ligase [Thermoanaerobaculia bacterium]